MKILLVGEFSGLHVNLKEGLIALGHDVTLASYSDGYKKVPGADISFDRRHGGLCGKVENMLLPFFNIKKLFGYDIVQFISFKVFNPRLGINSLLIKEIIKNNGKTFLVGAGCDSFLWRIGKNKLKYGWFEDNLKYDVKANVHGFDHDNWFEWNEELLERVDGYIPVAYEYQVGYEGHKKLRNGIPMPINAINIEFNANEDKEGPISVIHGLSRYGFKGTRFVESAFENLKPRYKGSASFDIFGHLPLNEYLALIRDTDILVDQLWSHSTGMNALYGLAQGKIVLGGAEPESLNFLKVKNSPVLNVLPSSEGVISVMDEILSWNRTKLHERKLAGREFVETIHNHITVADRFVAEWKK